MSRVPADKLANGVVEMSVRWIQAGHNAIEMPPEKILNVLFAWEEVHKSRYMPETGKFI